MWGRVVHCGRSRTPSGETELEPTWEKGSWEMEEFLKEPKSLLGRPLDHLPLPRHRAFPWEKGKPDRATPRA